jgi:hypothetical protein
MKKIGSFCIDVRIVVHILYIDKYTDFKNIESISFQKYTRELMKQYIAITISITYLYADITNYSLEI